MRILSVSGPKLQISTRPLCETFDRMEQSFRSSLKIPTQESCIVSGCAMKRSNFIWKHRTLGGFHTVLFSMNVNFCVFNHCTVILITKSSDEYLYSVPIANMYSCKERDHCQKLYVDYYILLLDGPWGNLSFSFKITFKLICFKACYYRHHESLLPESTDSLKQL